MGGPAEGLGGLLEDSVRYPLRLEEEAGVLLRPRAGYRAKEVEGEAEGVPQKFSMNGLILDDLLNDLSNRREPAWARERRRSSAKTTPFPSPRKDATSLFVVRFL